ncbi:MAG: response regulator, partial [Gemmatimonadota bacterium]|nr:response regulator [Gemmatimonadota bacterium]
MPTRILVVEDSPTQAERLVAHLEAAGHIVQAATTAEAALDRLDAGAFDLVLSDVVMPGMGGYDFCRVVKAQQPELPVLLLTSLSDPMDIIR